MARLIALLLVVPMLWPVARAQAGEDQSICRIRTVQDVMARELHKLEYYARVLPQVSHEVPESIPTTVLCEVTAFTLVYDARVAADAPLGHFEQHLFRVRAVSNGFVVRYLH